MQGFWYFVTLTFNCLVEKVLFYGFLKPPFQLLIALKGE